MKNMLYAMLAWWFFWPAIDEDIVEEQPAEEPAKDYDYWEEKDYDYFE